MVKKLLFVFILLISCINAHAQFEEGKWYLNTSLTGLEFSRIANTKELTLVFRLVAELLLSTT